MNAPSLQALPALPEAHRRHWALHPAQRAVWLDLQLAAKPLAYQLTGSCWIDGPLSETVLQQSLTLLAARHDALRLRVEAQRPVQWLHDEPIAPLNLHTAQSNDQAVSQRAALLAQVLPLGEAPLFAFDLIRVSVSRAMLLWRFHHLIADGMSLDLVLQRWLQTCQVLSEDTPQELPAGSCYTEHLPSAESDSSSDDPALRPHLQYWRERLAQRSSTPLFSPPSTPGASAQHQVWTLDGADYQRFVQACQAQKLSTQQALQGLYTVALASRYDQWDVTVGLALHGREFAHNQVIGMFSKALPVRVQLDPLSTLKRSVTRVAEQMSADFRHQAVPTDVIARAVAQGHEPKPLYEAALTLRQVPASPTAVRIGHLSIQTLATPHVEIGALGWHVMEHLGSHLSFALCHRPDLLDAAEPAALAAQLRSLMQAFASPGNTWLFEQAAVTAAEHAALLQPLPLPQAHRLEDLIAQRCLTQPEAVALIEGEQRWRYADLQRLSSQRAQCLRTWLDQQPHTGPEPVVALCQARSADTVIWMLAILQAQAVILPIDPHLPAARQHFMVKDAGAVLSIGLGPCPADWPGPWWPSDAAPEVPPSGPSLRTGTGQPQHLAYLIYTSGSTGQPKPVAVPHAAVCNLVQARAHYYAVGPGDRVLATNAVGFDVSISQLLMPLAQGACIVMAPPLRGLAPEQFWRLVSEQEISHLNATPSVMEAMLDHPALSTPRSLIVGGEALTRSLARRLMHALPQTRILNVYGPTETCIDATQWALNDHPQALQGAVTHQAMPIGLGLLNYQVMVLDSQWRLAAPGVVGEIFIGGAGLARGYLGQARLTAERFVPNPFGLPGSRMYRTGDRGLWRADGEIEFLGRRDDQVKVRGFRIQTGEIAAALSALPGVTHAVVLARPLVKDGEPALVAYWQGEGWTPARLRDALAQHLPEYMLPMAYVAVAALPLTVNQKLDWRALPEPGLAHLVQAQAHEAPEGDLEQELAALWQVLLGVPHIGRHDSFFALGGHSLGLVRLAEQLRQRGWAVDMAALFGRPTIAALAQQLTPLAAVAPSAPLLPLEQAPWAEVVAAAPGGAANVEALLPLTAMQHGLLFHHVLHPQDDGYQEIIHLRFASHHDALTMVEALRHLLNRHQALRAALRWEGLPQPVQMVLREVTLPVRHWDPAAPEIPRLDLRHAPLMAVALQETEADQACELVLSCHHLIMDHESMALLVRETVAHHQGLPLPEPGLLSDWMARQQPQRSGNAAAYFAQALQGVTRGTVPYGLTSLEREPAGRRLRQGLSATLSAALRQRAQEQGVSPAAVFHLAWLRCLVHVCGHSDVVTGTVLLGRSHATAALTMGMFINTLPLRLALGNLTPAAALHAVHQALAGLMAHEQAPLSQALAAAGLPPQEPLFTSLLNYRHSDHKAVSLAEHWPGLEVLAMSESATFVIDVAVDDEGEGFTLSLEVDGRLDPAPLAALLQEALTLLSQHLGEARPLLSWPLHSALLPQATAKLPEAPVALHGAALFKAAAQRHPEALALCDERRQMRYGEVAHEVHRRARALRQARAGLAPTPEAVVGLALERSIEVVLWLLALHEAGMTALPLDVSHPLERLNAMLQDSRALCMISDQATRDWRVPVWHELPPSTAEPTEARHVPQDVAYIIYTSGSTGQPKGVAVPHTALAHLSASRHVNDPLHPGDVVLATSSIGFDIAMGQLLLPLYRGATVVVSPPLRELDATQLSALLSRHRVTHVDGVPSFYEVLLQGPAPSHLVSATLGGERITPQLVRRLRAAWPRVRLLNVYGPTETTIDGTAWVLPPQQALPPEASQVPIGQAMPFYKAYVLDAHWQPVPPGAPGELWLGGACVARGYVHQPALTAERFVPDPWGAPGSRMYRTGDRVSLQSDGQLVFLGRQDAQVKLRGHRIELAEIEQRLLSHPAVRRVVLRVQHLGAQGQAHLVAYLEGEACASAELRQHCLQTLPAYMCPSVWVWLDALPCTPNGKVDLAALPTPDLSSQRDLSRALTAPRDATEATLLALWQQVLEQADISMDDDFFELGGNSLALLRLHASMSERLGQALPLRLLFEHATIASQAEALRTAAAHPQSGSGLLALRPAMQGNTQAPLFAVYPYGGTSFCYAELARLLPQGRAVWGLQAQGLEPGEVALRSLSEMAALALRQVRSVQAEGPLHLLGYSMGGLIAVEMAAQAEAAGERVALLALLDSPLPGLPNDRQGVGGHTEVLADVVQGLLPHLPPAALPTTLDELQAQLAATLPAGTALSRDDVQRLLDVASGMLEAARRSQALQPPRQVQTWLQVCADDGQQPPVDWQPWLQQPVPTLTLKTRHDTLMTGPAARSLADWLAPWIQAQDGEPHA